MTVVIEVAGNMDYTVGCVAEPEVGSKSAKR